MRHLTTAFGPFIVCLVAGILGIFSNALILGAPALVCGTPASLFWAGYYIGKAGATLQAPISFNGRTQATVSAEDIALLQRLKARQAAQQRTTNDQVHQQTAREFDQ